MDLEDRKTARSGLEAQELVDRIRAALEGASSAIHRFVPGAVEAGYKAGGQLVTEADHAANHALRDALQRDGEGWLSEESLDDGSRLGRERVWVVDPLDGTLEFVAGIPEWCISVALVEQGQPVAGGIRNPATGETILGARGLGVFYNGSSAAPTSRESLQGALVLASRSEVKRGEWRRFEHAPFRVRPSGSVAYKLGLVAAGRADATWTLTPKNEWDVAAGVALMLAAPGFVRATAGRLDFNRPSTRVPGLVACGPKLAPAIEQFLAADLEPQASP